MNQNSLSKHSSSSPGFESSDGVTSSADLTNGNDTDTGWSRADSRSSDTAKKLYEGPHDKDGYRTWLDEPPEEIAEAAARKFQRQAHPIVLRYLKSLDESGDKVFLLDSLVIQSELLKTAVRDILQDYPTADQYGIHTNEPTFEPPFPPFFHRWDTFEQYLASDKGNKDVELLHSILQTELTPIWNEVRNVTKHDVITFNLLWTLFPPGTMVFGRLRGQDHVFITKQTRRRQLPSGGPLVLDVIMNGIDWDATRYGQCQEIISIMSFAGEKKINQLEAFPAKYHQDEKALMQRLTTRGKKYGTLVKGGYKAYNGLLFPADYSDSRFIEGRILIDDPGYKKYNPYVSRPLEPLSGPLRSNAPGSGLTPEQLPFCTSAVRGFCLTIKKWAEFEVDRIEPIRWNDDAFGKLVMNSARKRLIRALVKEQQSSAQAQVDDVIQGKGLGLIMLLSGPPGTGKTLTAESIADALRLPFYVLSATELGDDIQQIEKSLQDVFQLTAGWNAVMLLDEADAFLEKRTEEISPEGSKRNKRVAAFLRLLEYYKGTLILTTNRPITFDEAFSSRIHLTLRFRPLDAVTRREIWANFLGLPHGIPNPNLDDLSRFELNGREIKNVVKMARLLARNEGGELSFEHVKDVMEVMEISLGGPQEGH